MKLWMSAALAAAAASCFAGFVVRPQGVALENGCVTPIESGKLLFNANLKGKNPDLASYANYENKLAHCFEMMDGSPVLVIRNPKHGAGDTAWNFITRKINLKGTEKRLLLEIDCKVTTNLRNDKGGAQWSNRISWYNAAGKIFTHTKFKYKGAPGGFIVTQIPVVVPAGAKALVIQLGADNPNVCGKNYQAYRAVRLREGAAGKDFTGTSSFVSPVFQNAAGKGFLGLGTSGKVSWQGDFPAGSNGKVQITWAPDDNGTPGKWSPFVGPNGTEKSFYGNGDALRNIPASAKWFRYKFIFRSGKKAPVLKEVKVGQFTDNSWTHFYDTIAPMVVNTTPAVRDFKKQVSVKIVDNSLIDWKTLQFSVDGKDVTKEVKIRGNTVAYAAKAPYADKLHSFTVAVSDVEGNRTTAKRYFDFVPMPKSNIVTLRDDGMVLIDKKPFFPIGIYAMAKKPWNNNNYDNGFRDVKAAGFNMVHTYRSTRDKSFYEEFLPAAKKYGIKLFIAGPKGANSHDMKPLIDTVRKEKSNPNILSWYLADDTSGYWSPDELAEMSDAVRAADPSRITCQADGARGYAGFGNSTDIFLPEIYPVREIDAVSSDQCVAQVISDMKFSFEQIELAGNPTVSVWAIIQYFKGWSSWKRFPTARELRAMNYASIIHGAHGITWYTYAPGNHHKHRGAASTPENWKIMSDASKELNQLIPVFCERKAKVQPAVKILSGPEKDLQDHPSVTGLLKKHNGRSYWITVNSTVKPVTASFTLPGLKGGKVLFENRTITVKNGVLTDKFAPYDVHVYELK